MQITKLDVTEARRLRLSEGWTLAKIAKYFGLSRQRVSQLIGNTGRISNPEHRATKRVIPPARFSVEHIGDKLNVELANIFGVSQSTISRWRHILGMTPSSRSAVYRGQLGETSVLDQLSKRGYPVQVMPYGAPFDLRVGKYRIDVKFSRPTSPSSPRARSIEYQFGVRQGYRHRTCDFYVFVTSHEDIDYFIVPVSAVPAKMWLVKFSWPTKRIIKPRWQDYHNRWDLLGDT